MAYELVEPFGSPAQEKLAARVITNLLMPHVRDSASIDPSDFVPDREAGLREYLERRREEITP